MHEFSLVRTLLERIERARAERDAARVMRVRVRIGELSGVEPALFDFAFAALRAGTCCESAALQIEREPVEFACDHCGAAAADLTAVRCPNCGRPLRLTRGDALVLEQIELELEHV